MGVFMWSDFFMDFVLLYCDVDIQLYIVGCIYDILWGVNRYGCLL